MDRAVDVDGAHLAIGGLVLALSVAILVGDPGGLLGLLRASLPWLPREEPPLCLHFDVNETIMLGDPAGGDSYEDSLNKILAKAAFLRIPDGEHGPWRWHDGSPLRVEERDPRAPPPPLLFDAFEAPPGCVSFYAVPELKAAFAKTFVSGESPGVIYAAEMERLRAALRWPAGAPRDARLCSDDGFYTFLPSFFHALLSLRQSGRRFSVVLRTFGSDLPRVVAALDAFSSGKHPLYPGLVDPALRIPPQQMWAGRYTEQGDFALLQDPGGRLGASKRESIAENHDGVVLAEAAALQELQGRGGGAAAPRMSAVQDDYAWWSAHRCSPSAGKPLWLSGASEWIHLFFDDNIFKSARRSIVAVRARTAEGCAFRGLSGAATVKLQGSVLRKVTTRSAVLDIDYFVRRIGECEERVKELRRRDRRGRPDGMASLVGP